MMSAVNLIGTGFFLGFLAGGILTALYIGRRERGHRRALIQRLRNIP